MIQPIIVLVTMKPYLHACVQYGKVPRTQVFKSSFERIDLCLVNLIMLQVVTGVPDLVYNPIELGCNKHASYLSFSFLRYNANSCVSSSPTEEDIISNRKCKTLYTSSHSHCVKATPTNTIPGYKLTSPANYALNRSTPN